MNLTKKEKFNLMINIMTDLRGDWSNNCESRANKIKEIALELGHVKTVILVEEYFEYINITGDTDGRHFRCNWEEYGGYEGAPNMLKNDTSISKKYIQAIQDNCNYPEYRLGKLK